MVAGKSYAELYLTVPDLIDNEMDENVLAHVAIFGAKQIVAFGDCALPLVLRLFGLGGVPELFSNHHACTIGNLKSNENNKLILK